MSTSDAGELELRVVGGETPPPQYRTARATRTTAAREQQDDTTGERIRQETHHGDETPTGQQCHPSAIRQEETHEALILRDSLRQEEAACCGDSEVQTQKPTGPRFTSGLFFRLSRNLGLGNPEQRLKKDSDPSLHSLTDTQRAETENSSWQVNGQTSPTDTSVKVASDSPLSERIPAKKREDITVVCNELLPCGSQSRTGTRSVDLEEDKQTDSVELSNPTRTMLSSTMVTVLAPHWSGRLRRTKRFEGTGNLEAQGNFQDMTTAPNRTQEHLQEMDRSWTDGSQAQLRVPFLGTRRSTVGSSTKSGPASLDYESKRKLIQTISLDVNSGRMDNQKRDAGALSPAASTVSRMSPLSFDPNERRRNPQTVHQEGLSSLNSKPTTSSLLLSLRRSNSNGRSPNAASTLSEMNPSSLSSSPRDQDGQLFTTHLSHNNNAEERSKPLLSPSSISYRTTETGSMLSPSSSNHRERTIFESQFFSASPTNKDTEDAPFTQQPQRTNRTQSSLSCSKQPFLHRGPLEWQMKDKSTHLLSESSVSSPRHSPYDRSPLLNTHSVPRTTLTSTSWWKQVTQEGSSPVTLNDTTNIKDNSNTPLVPPCNDTSNLASPSLTDKKRLSSQIPNNRDNNNTTVSVCKDNLNLVMKTQRNSEESSDNEDRLVKQQYDSKLNFRQPQKPHSLPDVLSTSKISRATAQTILSHPQDLTKRNGCNSSFTVNVTELPPTLLNSKSSDTPTESSSKYNNNHCTSKTNNTPISPHNKNPQRFTKPSISFATTNTLSSQALTSKTASALPVTPNTKIRSSINSDPVASQTNIHASSYAGSSSQTPRFTNTAANIMPLGFERSYASVPKPCHPKTVASLIPTVSVSSKTSYSPVSTASTIFSSTNGSHPTATTTTPSPSLLSPLVTPGIVSFPTTITSSCLLTPPATPILTSPNCPATSSPKEVRTFSSSQERDTKKLHPHVEGKRVRRVTWEDSVDLQCSEPITAEKSEQSQVPTHSSSPSRSPRGIKAPYIFSFLRSSSPTSNASPLCSPTPKTSSLQVVKGGKYRSLSSDSADLASRGRERSKQRPSDAMISDQKRQNLTTPRQERTLSVESGTVQCHYSAPLSLPPDFSRGYKLRYSSPPYSTLMSTRSTQGDTKTTTPRSPLFQQPSQSNYTPHLSVHNDPVKVTTVTKPPLSPTSLPQPISLPFQNKTATGENSKGGVSETNQRNNNHRKNNSQDSQNGQILLINNRVHISSQSQQGDEADVSSTFVTETLVYSIKSKVDKATAAPKSTTPTQHTAKTLVSGETKLSQQSNTVQNKEAADHSDQGSSSGSSTGSQPPDDESSNRRMKESVLGKSRFFSVESNNEQSPKRSRFALKKSVSTPNSSLSRSESDRASKTNKMDQVLNRLRQTFSSRRSDDDMLFPWKWKRASQTPSVGGSSDISNVSDVSVESTKTIEKQAQEKGGVLKDNEKGTEATNRWTQNKYTLTPSSASGNTMAGDTFYIWPDKPTPDTDQDMQNTCTEYKNQSHLTHNPTIHQFNFYKDETDYNPTNQFLSCRDPSPGRNPNPSVAYPSQYGKSTSSPRSPFSPFSSLSPLSSFPSSDVTDDSVFYSPKLQRRRQSSSPCEPGEGISLGGSRRSRASTGPPSASPVQDKECLASSYADLKYGIEPGRSFSVCSVLSSRPSGPGRISTGSRFMSVGDLSECALTCGGTGKDLDHWSVNPDWTTKYDHQPSKDCQMSYFPSDPGKMRSRSLPRSLTRRLANWSSGVPTSPPVNTTTSKSTHLWSPNMGTCHFGWDTEGPPTPPPTPPLSPVSRRMSRQPSLSPPTFPSSPGVPQQVDSQSSRGHLPSRDYVSSLSIFEESSDSSSDTTTDDEYYLETGEDVEKETEL